MNRTGSGSSARSAGGQEAGDEGEGSQWPDSTAAGTPADSDFQVDAGSVSAGNLVLVVSAKGQITSVPNNPNGALDESIAAGSSIDKLWSPDTVAWVRDNLKRTLRSRQVHTAEFDAAADGKHFEFIFVATGRDSVLLVARDISERVSKSSKMQHLAYVDSVTGLPNREHLHKELTGLLETLRLREGRAAIICFDIDQVDLHGRVSSASRPDAIMKQVGARLRHGLRCVNDPEPVDLERYSVAARIDYRQFGVILPEISGGEDAIAVTKRLTESMQQPIDVGDGQVRVTVRAGIALFPQDGTDTDTLFGNAMTAMDDARRNQTDPCKLHTGTVRMRAIERKDLEIELRTALDRDEFDLNYLPAVDARSNDVVSTEALLRWPKALFGSKSIQRVVTLAEHTGLIVPIGEWVMRRSCEQLRRWHDSGHEGMRLAINISVQEFSRKDLPDKLGRALDIHSVAPEFVDLEITEHMLFRDAMKAFQGCNALKDLGVGIVLDDYGTGACSVGHLSRSPVDAVKIDNGFVGHAIERSSDRDACAAIIAMAHELGMRVIAEGVETEAQADLLRDQGCDMLQGYYFCKPLPALEFGEFLRDSGSDGGSGHG